MVRQNAILAAGLPEILAAAQRAARGKRRSADVAAFMLDAERCALSLARELVADPECSFRRSPPAKS